MVRKKLNDLVERNQLKIHHYENQKPAQTWSFPIVLYPAQPAPKRASACGAARPTMLWFCSRSTAGDFLSHSSHSKIMKYYLAEHRPSSTIMCILATCRPYCPINHHEIRKYRFLHMRIL